MSYDEYMRLWRKQHPGARHLHPPMGNALPSVSQSAVIAPPLAAPAIEQTCTPTPAVAAAPVHAGKVRVTLGSTVVCEGKKEKKDAKKEKKEKKRKGTDSYYRFSGNARYDGFSVSGASLIMRTHSVQLVF